MSLSVKDRVQLLETSALGLSSEAIAAIIGVDVTDVVAVRTHPDANPPTPGGGAGPGIYTYNDGNLSARAPSEADLVFFGEGGDFSLVDLPAGTLGEGTPAFTGVVLAVTPPDPFTIFRHTAVLSVPGVNVAVENSVALLATDQAVASAASAPMLVPAGAGNGFRAYARAPIFSAGTVEAQVWLWASNAAGTEIISAENDAFALESGTGTLLDLTADGWNISNTAGADLSASATGIDSTAGGAYSACLVVQFTCTELVP